MYTLYLLAALLTTGNDPGSTTSINNLPTGEAGTTVANILNITYFIAGIVAVIVIIIAGFFYVTSQGKPANVTKAKDAILYSVIGIVVIMLAFVITQFVVGRF